VNPPPRPSRLSPDEVERGLALSIKEGVGFALMVGLAETYIFVDSVRLGATPFVQGLLVTLPLFLGSLGPLLALSVLTKLRQRRRLVAVLNTIQGLNLAVIGALDYLALSTPYTLLANYALHQVLGQAAGTAWTSWFGDLIPSGIRGRYLARRNAFVYTGIGVGILAGGAILQALKTGGEGIGGDSGRGFAVLFALAGIARLSCAWMILRTPEPRFAGVAPGARVKRFLATERGSSAWRLVVFGFCLQAALYVSGPYYAPYMMEDLGFEYWQYTAASLSVTAARIALLPAWGRAVDQLGARPAYLTGLLLLSFVPLPWVFMEHFYWVLIAQAFSGLAWSGYEVSMFGLLVSSSYRDTRAHLSAIQQFVNGCGQLLGGMLGAWIASLASNDLRVVFAVGTVARLVFAFAAPWMLPSMARERVVARREVFMRVVGFRAGGGLSHRPDFPIPERDDEDELGDENEKREERA
jgi:MFS family permease